VDATALGGGLTSVLGDFRPSDPLSTPFGELLLDVWSELLLLSFADSGGTIARHSVPVPDEMILIGRMVHTPAVLLAGPPRLANAIDLRIGI
jgi:hypothetical protein